MAETEVHRESVAIRTEAQLQGQSMNQHASGGWFANTLSADEVDLGNFPKLIATDRYYDSAIQDQERERVWMKVWQVVGRADALPNAGDWKVYSIFDQSYIIVRGKDQRIRGFVNACRHRGNALCEGEGHSARFTCPYHLWSFDIEGKLIGVARPDLVGPIDKDSLGLIEVPVDCFAGFVFMNPDPNAIPLLESLGDEVIAGLSPYRLDEMTPVGMDVREQLDCNWKVVIDAFSEGYHIIGVHPELLSVIDPQPGNSRFGLYGDHGMACAPFEVKNAAGCGLEEQVEGIRALPSTFPTVTEVLPVFDDMIAQRRDAQGNLQLGTNETVRTLFQQATRETLTQRGVDVSDLTDEQMSDSQGWFLFPNFFMTIRAGEATVIMALPDPDGDPNRCIWHVTAYMWLPPEVREDYRAEPVTVSERGSYPYFLALQQDYDQMQRQQNGLKNRGLKHMSITREEISVARFHEVLDRYLAG